MPKRFKFRFSGVIPTFQFCRPSKHTSDLPSDPFLSFLHCLRLRSAAQSSDLKWTKSNNWHVFDPDAALPRRKIYNSAASASDEEEKAEIVPQPLYLPLPPPRGKRRSSRFQRKKKSHGSVRLSISSAESGLFSDDEKEIGEEIETLVSNSNSSRSFSTDSSTEFNPHLETIREGPTIRPNKHNKKKKKKKKTKTKKLKIGGKQWPDPAAEDDDDISAARLSAVFRKLVPCAAAGVEGKVRESLAVVKRSDEPYEDFKKSMVEMIVEKEMVEEKDLQELLRCFLSLNSEQHHGIIIRAFDDIMSCSLLL